MDRDFIKNSLRFLPAFSPGSLSKLTGQKLLLPLYHSIQTEYQPHIQHLYTLRDERLFRRDVAYLLKHYEPVNLQQIIQHLRGERHIKNPSFFITFDDGLSEFGDIAVPILQGYGLTAAVFVNPAFADNKGLMHRYKASLLISHIKKGRLHNAQTSKAADLLKVQSNEDAITEQLLKINYLQREVLDEIADVFEFSFDDFLKRHKPYISLNELKELQQEGFYIGAHSMDHPEMELLPPEAQKQQVLQSMEWVQQHFNPDQKAFAFPFTDTFIKPELFSHIKKGIDVSFGTAGIKGDDLPYNLQRLPVEGTTASMASILNAEYLYYLLKQPLGKNRMKR